MKRSELFFNRPPDLAATSPAEARGETRDMGRLLVSTPTIQKHASFLDLPSFLQPGDLLVVNRSATMPASLPAAGLPGAFILNLSTHYGSGLWLVEPRHSPSRPGPLPIELCSEIRVAAAGITGRFVAPYPGLPRKLRQEKERRRWCLKNLSGNADSYLLHILRTSRSPE